jgi:hypothetical protein
MVLIMIMRFSVFIALLLLAPATILGEAKDPLQEQIVTIISDIDSYVSWPAVKAAENGKPFFVALLGKSPLATKVEELNRTKLPDGRIIRVRFVQGDLLPANAHIVINSLTDEKLVKEYHKKLVGTSTLTIGIGDVDLGTVLHMDIVEKDGKSEVRTTLDSIMASDEGLEIKSKLKKLCAK